MRHNMFFFSTNFCCLFVAADLDSARTTQKAHCYIQQSEGCGALVFLSWVWSQLDIVYPSICTCPAKFYRKSVTSPSCSLIEILTWIPLILVCHVCGYSALTTYQQFDLILTYSNLSPMLQVVLTGRICHWDVGNCIWMMVKFNGSSNSP
jgi:hypothetical protein